MPRPLLIFSQSDYLIQVADTNSQTYWQTDLDLQCLQRQGISGISRIRVKDDYGQKVRSHIFSVNVVILDESTSERFYRLIDIWKVSKYKL